MKTSGSGPFSFNACLEEKRKVQNMAHTKPEIWSVSDGCEESNNEDSTSLPSSDLDLEDPTKSHQLGMPEDKNQNTKDPVSKTINTDFNQKSSSDSDDENKNNKNKSKEQDLFKEIDYKIRQNMISLLREDNLAF